MKNNLLIVGAGIYSLIAKEIASDMGCFGKIAFIDDSAKTTPDGTEIIGTFSDIKALSSEYTHIIIAIGNPDVRERMIETVEKDSLLNLATLISPKAYVSPLATVEKGCFIEPMAVVHAGSRILKGSIICAGAVVNHSSVCSEYVHIDCNATVVGFMTVPPKTKIQSGSVFKNVSDVTVK